MVDMLSLVLGWAAHVLAIRDVLVMLDLAFLPPKLGQAMLWLMQPEAPCDPVKERLCASLLHTKQIHQRAMARDYQVWAVNDFLTLAAAVVVVVLVVGRLRPGAVALQLGACAAAWLFVALVQGAAFVFVARQHYTDLKGDVWLDGDHNDMHSFVWVMGVLLQLGIVLCNNDPSQLALQVAADARKLADENLQVAKDARKQADENRQETAELKEVLLTFATRLEALEAVSTAQPRRRPAAATKL